MHSPIWYWRNTGTMLAMVAAVTACATARPTTPAPADRTPIEVWPGDAAVVGALVQCAVVRVWGPAVAQVVADVPVLVPVRWRWPGLVGVYYPAPARIYLRGDTP